MGDLSHSSTSDTRATDHNLSNTGDTGGPLPSDGGQQNAPEYALYQQQSYPINSHQAFTPQFDMAGSPSVHRPGPYNMGPMANALPPVAFRFGQYPHSNQQRYPMPNSPSTMQHIPQFVNHQPVQVSGQGYYVQQPQMAQYYGGHYPQAQNSGGVPPRQNMTYYPNQMIMNQQQAAYYYQPTPQYPTTPHGMPNAAMPGQYLDGNSVANDSRAASQSTGSSGTHPTPPKQAQVEIERRQSAVRGPPRKPRQSGHAIWIGNLPPQTDLMSLVHHVCKEAPGLESLFLISKSNCAFANFKNESTCMAAQQKLHDSKFQSVRLVSRLRKSTVEGTAGVTAPTGPAVVTSNPGSKTEQPPGSPPVDSPSLKSTPDKSDSLKQVSVEADGTAQRDKFFVLKSLTVEDLELSVRTGIWATQSHNEDALNNAFKAADSVYLVFSANKSGEYFGYARMVSEINEDPAAAIEFAPKAPTASDLNLPKAIPTEATKDAPKGRIIDDSARGTIFWEAERDEPEASSDTESVSSGKSAVAEEGPAKTWGKPFKLEWHSTTHLPFYRTRGLRNPWNSNREVKIARDGTELEPSVGRRLIGLFNRVQSPPPAAAPMPVPMAVMPGFPQMRPYGQ